MHIIIALVGLIAFVSNATALNCFLCLGSTNSDCSRGEVNAMVIQRCEASLPALQNTTLSKLALPKVQFDAEEPPIVTRCISFAATSGDITFAERGCGFIWEGVDICEYMKGIVELHACEYCNEDICNISPINV